MSITAARASSVFKKLFNRYGGQAWWPARDAFEVMLGAVLTQNTSWHNVEKALANLRDSGALNLSGLEQMTDATLATCLRPSGYFNIKLRRVRALCVWLRKGGGFARLKKLSALQLRHQLLGVHGVGPETADAILLYAFEKPVFVIDAYTRRLVARLGWVTGNESYEDLRRGFEDALQADVSMYNEYHALIVAHGKAHCRIKPRCENCCLRRQCDYRKKHAIV